MGKLENKSVFITGGLSGIGKACALAAAREGANVAVADLPSDKTDEAMRELKEINSRAIFVEGDVSKFEAVEAAIRKVVDTFGSLDVALNNAGIGGEQNKVGDMSQAQWLKVIDVNLNGVFNCMKHELAQMAKQGSGSIINMSSILGKVGFANSAHYVAAKHGVLGMTKAAALEYGAEGIRINAICPAFIATPLLDKAGLSEDENIKQAIVNLHPMKRLGKPDELGGAFIFLASDDSTFVTGTALEVDGGFLAQ